MNLPDEDCQFLADKGFVWELLADGGCAYLVIKGYPLAPEKYDRAVTDLMLRIPAGFPMAKLDMFWVDPPLKLKGGAYPPAAEHFEIHAGRNWQRFSRHLQAWQPGVDGLRSFMALISRELRGKV